MGNRVMPVILSLAVVMLFVFTTFGPHGLLHLREINNELDTLKSKNHSLEQEIATLTRQVNEVKHSRFFLEKKAREEHGLSRPGEIVYMFTEGDTSNR